MRFISVAVILVPLFDHLIYYRNRRVDVSHPRGTEHSCCSGAHQHGLVAVSLCATSSYISIFLFSYSINDQMF